MEGSGSCAQLTNPQVTKRKVLPGAGLGQMVGKWLIRASPAAFDMWFSRVRLDEEKSKSAGLAPGGSA